MIDKQNTKQSGNHPVDRDGILSDSTGNLYHVMNEQTFPKVNICIIDQFQVIKDGM